MISITNLTYYYHLDEPLFENLSIKLENGSIIGLLGKNGAGKTTLLKLISGLIYPKIGEIEVLGCTAPKRHPQLLEQLYFIPEEIYLPDITIEQYIKANSLFYSKFDFRLLDQLLDECELKPQMSIPKLSFGKKKMFLISFALATKCRVLLLDEPTNGIDIPSKGIFRKIVAGALTENQVILISTHQVKDIEHLIDHLIILDQANIVLNKSINEITSHLQSSRRQTLNDIEVLYSEAAPEGYHVISPQTNGNSVVELELLFNAVIHGKTLINDD